MNGFAPAALSTSSTAETMLLMLWMPRLPTATAICARGFNRDKTFCALNSLRTTAGISSGGDGGNFCRTTNMRGKGMEAFISTSVRVHPEQGSWPCPPRRSKDTASCALFRSGGRDRPDACPAFDRRCLRDGAGDDILAKSLSIIAVLCAKANYPRGRRYLGACLFPKF